MATKKEIENCDTPNIACVDLFCGVGGLTHGLVKGGVDVRLGVDIDPASKFPYEANNPSRFLLKDVNDIDVGEINSSLAGADYTMLAGCAPCQPFSTYSQGKRDKKDSKWSLLSSFGDMVDDVSPDFLTMENVPQLLDYDIFNSFVARLADYHVWYDVVDCPNYGIPQRRKRLVLLASKIGPISLVKPTHKMGKGVSVKRAIAKLPEIKAGETCSRDPLHTASSLTPINLKRIRQSKPGGTWRDWDEELLAACHRRSSGATFPAVYGRMTWDDPAPTITTQCYGYGNGRFGHPEQDRAISLREAAIFQTFPKKYKFLEKGEKAKFSVLGRLIGNAVPVRLGEVIAHSIYEHIACA